MSEKTAVLIVDDERKFCETMTDILEAKGYEVESENSGAAAIAKVQEKFFSVVLMDIKMPVMNGVEAFKLIKKISPKTVVIMMTAFSVEQLIHDTLREGAFCCLHKPLDVNKLLKQIDLAKGKGKLILIMDDDHDIRETFKDTLEVKGYRVSTAATGEEATLISKDKPHDILFLDLKLATLNGLEVYLAIKKINPKAIAVIISNHEVEMKDLREKGFDKNVYACLAKPLDMDKVFELIEEISEKIRIGALAMAAKILIVDDCANMRTTLTSIFAELGYEITEAASGEEALEKVHREKPDLILLDTCLPGIDGFEVCRQIKRAEKSDPKVIVYTGKPDVVDAVKARRMGADDYCVKGTNPSPLVEAVENCLIGD